MPGAPMIKTKTGRLINSNLAKELRSKSPTGEKTLIKLNKAEREISVKDFKKLIKELTNKIDSEIEKYGLEKIVRYYSPELIINFYGGLKKTCDKFGIENFAKVLNIDVEKLKDYILKSKTYKESQFERSLRLYRLYARELEQTPNEYSSLRKSRAESLNDWATKNL